MTDILPAKAVSVGPDEDTPEAILLWLHGPDHRPIAGIALDVAGALALCERLQQVTRRVQVEILAGPSASAVIN